MKKLAITLTLAAMLPASAAFAQQAMDDMKMMDMAQQPAAGAHAATGVIKKIDLQTGMVTIAHEPIKSLNWPAMIMAFKMQNKAMLKTLSVGKKVDFSFVQEGSSYVITSIK